MHMHKMFGTVFKLHCFILKVFRPKQFQSFGYDNNNNNNNFNFDLILAHKKKEKQIFYRVDMSISYLCGMSSVVLAYLRV